MNPIFIDTAFVIGLVNRRDQYHTQALQLAQYFVQAGFEALMKVST